MGWVSAEFDEAAGAGGWRKGPWTPEEDKLLHHYVTLHGEGRWSSVAGCAGLNRSGKSCRLRWVNYLRPGLKRGHITPQEEAIIIELHALWGNKWSTIARYLPGRTDNEIKNYWRTHFKKKERMIINGRRQKYQVLPRNLMPHPHPAGGNNISVEKYSSTQQPPLAGSLQQQCVPTTVSQDAPSSSNWSLDQSSNDGGLWDAIWNYINGPSTSPDYSIGALYSQADYKNPLTSIDSN